MTMNKVEPHIPLISYKPHDHSHQSVLADFSSYLMFGLSIILPLEMTASICLVFSISVTGFADRINISASLPGSMVPVWFIKSRASTPFLVAIFITSDVLIPASTNNSSSRCRLLPATRSRLGISVPDRIFIPLSCIIFVSCKTLFHRCPF